MNISITQEQGKVPVTVLHIQGKLDGSNYKELIAKAQEVYQGGARDILIDLMEVEFMSSAGMVALHSIAKLLKGRMLEEEDGWESIRAIDRDRGTGAQKHLKLLNPQAKIEKVLDVAGFNQLFEIYKDLGQAIASFQ
jgi:anti-anti-sigma factor